MGRPKSRIDCEESSSGRAKGERWSQDEMDTLVSLCITHGRSDILSKETNKATCAKKDAQWATIITTYNTIHPPRDKSALIARYKFIVMHLRKDNAAQRSSVVTTGGGQSTSSKPPFEITAKMLELTNILGVSITGLPGFGSDSHAMETVTQTATEGDHGENAHSLETFSAPADNDEREEWSLEVSLFSKVTNPLSAGQILVLYHSAKFGMTSTKQQYMSAMCQRLRCLNIPKQVVDAQSWFNFD